MRPADPAEHAPVQAERTVVKMRRASALLASAAAVGGLIELAMLRHWSGIQIAPWVIFTLTAFVGLHTAAGGPKRLAQITGGLGLFGALAGLYHHLDTNRAIGAQTIDGWASLSVAEQWWQAFDGSVGAAPALAPGLLALAGTLLFVAVTDR